MNEKLNETFLGVLNSTGELINTYLKNHLVPVVEEPDTERGDGKTPVVEVDGVKYTYLICADYTSNKYRFPNANKENAFENPAEPDGFLSEAKKPYVRITNFWGNSLSYAYNGREADNSLNPSYIVFAIGNGFILKKK